MLAGKSFMYTLQTGLIKIVLCINKEVHPEATLIY